MTEREARKLQRDLEDMLDGSEIGYLNAEESEHIPGHWGVTLKLTSASDYRLLRRLLARDFAEKARTQQQ